MARHWKSDAALRDTGWRQAQIALLAAATPGSMPLSPRIRTVSGGGLRPVSPIACSGAAVQDRLAQAHIWTRKFTYAPDWLRLELPGGPRLGIIWKPVWQPLRRGQGDCASGRSRQKGLDIEMRFKVLGQRVQRVLHRLFIAQIRGLRAMGGQPCRTKPVFGKHSVQIASSHPAIGGNRPFRSALHPGEGPLCIRP